MGQEMRKLNRIKIAYTEEDEQRLASEGYVLVQAAAEPGQKGGKAQQPAAGSEQKDGIAEQPVAGPGQKDDQTEQRGADKGGKKK